MRKLLDNIRRKREQRRRKRDRDRRNLYHVEDLAKEDAQHDEQAKLNEAKPTVRWIDAEEGDKGYRFYTWLGGRAHPLGQHHVRLAVLKQELTEALGLLAKAEAKAAQLRDKLNGQRVRWFQDGLTKGQLLRIGLLVFVAEGIANFISFVMLPVPLVGQALFAVVFTALVTLPAHYGGVLGIDAIFNADHRHGHDPVERLHHKVVVGACLFLLGFAATLTVVLGLMRGAYFEALRKRHHHGLFAAVDPTALVFALLLGALAGVVVLVVVAAKHQAGELRRKWTAELKLTEGKRKELEQRCATLRVQIEEASAQYDVVAEQHAAEGLATRRRGAAIRAQYDRSFANEQRRLGREPKLPAPEGEPDPRPYYRPIHPAHQDLPVRKPEEPGTGNGAGNQEEAKRLLAKQRENHEGDE